MKFKKFLLILSMLLFFNYCASWKKNFKTGGGKEEAISNAIIDFFHTNSSIEEFNTFHVIEKSNEETIGISILGDSNKWILGELKEEDTNNYFPTKFKEIGDNLFYWSDSTEILNGEILDKMKEYHILDTTERYKYEIPASEGYSSEKGAVHYYFCRSNLLKYKKVKTDVSIGYYKFPFINCH